MESPGKSSQQVRFGEFILDLRTRELLVNGSKLDMQEQPFQVLSMLLERPGELVTREELTKRLWPADTFVDFENSLNRVIKRLREALGDSANEPRFIETLPRRGYRFIATVRLLPSPTEDSQAPPEPTADATPLMAIERRADGATRSGKRRTAFVLFALALGCLAGSLTYWLLFPARTLRVVAIRQLTTFGGIDPWGNLVSDGYRLYFVQREGDHWGLSQTSRSAGEPQAVPAPFRNTIVLAVSPDHANFLIASFVHRDDLMPLWIWPIQGGAPKRLGDILAYDGIWKTDGRSILYSEDDGIYQVNLDGTNVHKFVTTEGGHAKFFAWSPDGHTLGFSVWKRPSGSSIWLVNSDGTHLQRFLPGWKDAPAECCGTWSPDGRYFFFASRHSTAQQDIWVIREKAPFLHLGTAEPMRLTSGPAAFGNPVSSPDGHQLFVLGESGRGELVRYELRSRRFVPWLPTLSVFSLALSRDGSCMVYESSPARALVRINVDGSQPLVLTPAGLFVGSPSWSPDGKQVVFVGEKENVVPQIYLVAAEGGTAKVLSPNPRPQQAPTWSPDGKFIAFHQFENSIYETGASIYVFNLETHQTSLLPGSVGLRSPLWSPNGRFIAAYTEDYQKLMLLDLQTQQWTELARVTLLNGPRWSKDGKELYYQDLLAPDQPIYRIQMRGRKRELVTNFEAFLHSGVQRASLEGVAPDGSLIARLDRGGAYIFSLDLEVH